MTTPETSPTAKPLATRVIKGIGRALLVLALTMLVLCTAILAINSIDQAPTEAARLLATTPANEFNPRNGFIAYVGSSAPADTEVIAWGTKWIGAHHAALDKAAREAAAKNYPTNALPFKGDAKLLCEPGAASCIELARERGSAWRELVQANAVAMERQMALVEYPAFDEIYFAPHPESGSVYWSNPARRLALNLAALDAAEGRTEAALTAIGKRIAFDRRALEGSQTLISGMVAIRWLTEDYALLADLLAYHPRLATEKKSALMAMTEPLTTAQARSIAQRLFEGEGRWQIRALGNEFRALSEAEDFSELWKAPLRGDGQKFLSTLATQFLLPQATLNRLAADNLAFRQRVNAFSPESWKAWMAQEKQLADAAGEGDWSWLNVYNLTGRILARSASPDYSAYLPRIFNLMGITRLARLQVSLLADEANDADVTAKIAARKDLYDPFSNLPMGWDSSQRRLHFDSIRSAKDGDTRRLYAGLGRS